MHITTALYHPSFLPMLGGSEAASFGRAVKELGAFASSVQTLPQFLYLFPMPGHRFPLTESVGRRAESVSRRTESISRRAENPDLEMASDNRCAPPNIHAPPAFGRKKGNTCRPPRSHYTIAHGYHPDSLIP
jgi:hypothetical protein